MKGGKLSALGIAKTHVLKRNALAEPVHRNKSLEVGKTKISFANRYGPPCKRGILTDLHRGSIAKREAGIKTEVLHATRRKVSKDEACLLAKVQ